MIFSKNCLALFVSGREKNAHSRAHYLFGAKYFFDQNSENQEKHKNSGFSEIVQNQNDTFLLKRCFFDMGEKVCYTNCVF